MERMLSGYEKKSTRKSSQFVVICEPRVTREVGVAGSAEWALDLDMIGGDEGDPVLRSWGGRRDLL